MNQIIIELQTQCKWTLVRIRQHLREQFDAGGFHSALESAGEVLHDAAVVISKSVDAVVLCRKAYHA